MNIDILFNPDYKLDIIKYFVNLARTKQIIVQWCGIIENNYLMYSEQNYMDYVKYVIKDYNIACIK